MFTRCEFVFEESFRLSLTFSRITSLRLIQPRIDLQSAAQAALTFEHKAFQKAAEKVGHDDIPLFGALLTPKLLG